MKAIYRTNFEVRGPQSPNDLPNTLASTCWQWAFDPKRGFVAPKPMPSGCTSFQQVPLTAVANIEAICVEDGIALRWALRLSQDVRQGPAPLERRN